MFRRLLVLSGLYEKMSQQRRRKSRRVSRTRRRPTTNRSRSKTKRSRSGAKRSSRTRRRSIARSRLRSRGIAHKHNKKKKKKHSKKPYEKPFVDKWPSPKKYEKMDEAAGGLSIEVKEEYRRLKMIAERKRCEYETAKQNLHEEEARSGRKAVDAFMDRADRGRLSAEENEEFKYAGVNVEKFKSMYAEELRNNVRTEETKVNRARTAYMGSVSKIKSYLMSEIRRRRVEYNHEERHMDELVAALGNVRVDDGSRSIEDIFGAMTI